MTTQQNGPDAPSPAPGPTEESPESVRREPEEPRKFDIPKGTEGSGRFAYYDTTLGRYVGGVHDSKSDAKAAGKGAASGAVVEV